MYLIVIRLIDIPSGKMRRFWGVSIKPVNHFRGHTLKMVIAALRTIFN